VPAKGPRVQSEGLARARGQRLTGCLPNPLPGIKTLSVLLGGNVADLGHPGGMPEDEIIERVIALRQAHVMPVARSMGMELVDDPVLRARPPVLLLGNHSSGKSSFINHLLGRDVQRTGIAPTDDGFTILLHGNPPRILDGQALTSSPELPFTELSRFGPGLVHHMQGREVDCELLRHVNLIDSPGMIDSAGADSRRPYDFAAVVRWFAEKADLILLFFDPEKPGTTGETITVLTDSLAGIDHKLRIVMNKMDLFDGMRDFARTYGALCWNLSRSLRTKDLPHIYTTVLPGRVRDNPRLPLDDFSAALRELEAYIADLPRRREDSILSRVMDEARLVLMRVRVVEQLRSVVRATWVRTFAACLGATLIAGLVAWLCAQLISSRWQTDGADFWTPALGILPFLIALPLLWYGPKLRAQRAERRGIAAVDQCFRDAYATELGMRERADDLEHLWERTRPALLRRLTASGLSGIPRTASSRITLLQHCLESELPALRRTPYRPNS
jgi:hypothetical protein